MEQDIEGGSGAMKLKGVEGMSIATLEQEVQQGGRFVIYTFVFSIIIMTFRRSSPIYYIKPHTGAVGPGLKYTLITLLIGWWGIPWGPIYSIGGLISNFRGGKNVTAEVMNSFYARQMPQAAVSPAPGITQSL
jgi:hypothetical protein